MRKSIGLALLVILPLVAVASYAVECFSYEPNEQVWGYSSDEDFGGGSSYLGVDTRDVTSERLGDLKLKDEHGVEVTMVDQDAPAGKAGIKERDVILTLNGTAVESVEQLRRMIREVPPGRQVTLGISRAGQPITLKVQLADRKKAFAYSYSKSDKDFHFAMPAVPAMPIMPNVDMDLPVSVVVVHSSMRSGLMVENLTSQLGDFFGVKNGQGVLVRSVEKGSRAEKAGFRAGDVIVKVNGESVNDSGDFSHALRSRSDNTASVTILRDKKEQTLTLTLPERKQSGAIEESLDDPEIDQDAVLEIAADTADAEIAHLQPQMDLASREIERVQKELCEEERRMQEETIRMKRDLRKQQREIQDKVRHELRGEWTEI
jgi:membrane-associated protease RseP (regulator of RpoE activity)